MIKIEKFNEKDIPQFAKLSRISMERDSMPDFLFKEKTIQDIDYNPELAFTAFNEANEPVGFIQAVIRDRETEHIAYIKLFFVAPNFRRKKIGTKLYQEVEQLLRAKGIKKIRLFESYPNYFTPGLDPFYTEAVCFFERMGYKKFGDTSNLLCSLLDQDFNTEAEELKLKEDNIEVSRASKDDLDELLNWIKKNFAGWKGEILSCYENDPISIHISKLNGRISAFSAYESNNKGTGWFGPMGTDSSMRGKGIGGILLKRCLNDLKKMGFSFATIPWVGPIPFYMHYVNSKVHRIFWRYEKIME